jgi:hypothetical protein
VVRLGSIPSEFKAACLVVCFGAVCFAVTSGAVFARQQQGGAANEKTVLRGVVVNSVTHQPVGRALVKSTDGRFATMTNERGQFEMRFKVKIEAGNGGAADAQFATTSDEGTGVTVWQGGTNGGPAPNQQGQIQQGQNQQAQGQGQSVVDRPNFLTAVREGYLTPQSDWGYAVPVAAGQEEVTIPLTPEAKVVGHVTLADGEGAAGINVELYKQTVESGRARWNNVGVRQARSDGEFRFAGLEAGTYKLYSAELPERDPVTSDPRAEQGWGYPPDYYPSATDFAGGAAIQLSAGEIFQATLTPQERRYYAVHIGVVGGPRGWLDVEVEKNGHPGPGFSLGYNFRDGSINGMLPDGNYQVRASTGDNGLVGLANLSVRGGPATGMVRLLSGTDVEVRVNEEFGNLEEMERTRQALQAQPGGESHPSSTKQLRPALIQLQLQRAADFSQGRVYMAHPPGDPQTEGLVIPNVTAGEYQVSVQTQFGYVAAVRSGDTDLQASNLLVGEGSSVPVIEVTLRDDGGEVDGSIPELTNRAQGDTSPPRGFVYFVPVGSGHEMKLFVAQPNGDFQAMQLPPETYRVLAFERPKNDLEYANDDVMRKYDAQRVTVEAGQKAKIRVSLSAE